MPPRAIALPTGRRRRSTTYPKVPRGRATLSGVLRAMQGRGCRDPESLRGGGIVERVCSTLRGREGREPVRGHVGTSGATDRCCGGHEFCHAAAAVRSSGCYFNARPRERFSTERGGDLRRRAQPILYETVPDTDSCPHARARAAAAAAAVVVAVVAVAAAATIPTRMSPDSPSSALYRHDRPAWPRSAMSKGEMVSYPPILNPPAPPYR